MRAHHRLSWPSLISASSPPSASLNFHLRSKGLSPLSLGKGNVNVAADSLNPKYKLDRTPQFIRDEIANDFGSITGILWDLDRGTARFLPFDAKARVRILVPYSVPPHGNAAARCGQG